MSNIVCVVDRSSPDGKTLGIEFTRLKNIDTDICHTIGTHCPDIYKTNSNVIIEVKEVDMIYEQNTIPSRAEQSRAEQLNCRVIGQMDNTIDHTFESANRVYDDMGIAPTVNTCGGGGLQPKVIEVKEMGEIKTIVAMRGRDKDNPNDRGKSTENYEQRLEPNTQGTSNTITSVQKDNLVLEQKEIHKPKVKVRQATKDGFIEVELPGVADLNYESSTTRRGRVQEGGRISPTLTTENTPSLIELGDPDFHNFIYQIEDKYYLIRIRKLIPRECLRLMDVDEDIIDRMEKVESNTNLYKAAGNSIVVNCLVAILGQFFEGKENVYKELSE